jgi:hypothetical protein
MREIHKEKRMTVRVPREIWVMLREQETQAADDKAVWISHGDGFKKRPRQAQIAAAVLIHYGSLSETARRAILLDGIEKLNALIEEPDAASESLEPVDHNAAKSGPGKGSKGRRPA